MDVEIRESGPWTLIDLVGSFKGADSQKVKESCQNMIQSGKSQIGFNFKEVDFIDSAGMGAVIFCYQKLQAVNGQLVLIGLSPEVYDLFEMTSVDRLFKILDSEKELENL